MARGGFSFPCIAQALLTGPSLEQQLSSRHRGGGTLRVCFLWGWPLSWQACCFPLRDLGKDPSGLSEEQQAEAQSDCWGMFTAPLRDPIPGSSLALCLLPMTLCTHTPHVQ